MPAAPHRRRTPTRVCSVLIVLLLLSILTGMSFGSASVAPVTVATVLAAYVLPHGWIDVSQVSEADRVVGVVLDRTPRVLVAALVGVGLALAGAQMQGLFHNPTGAAVAVSGVIGFVGLVVPHIVRLLIGPAHRRVLPASALAGASFVILADVLARTILRPEELRLGMITAAFGAPFMYLLLTRTRDAVVR